jgi:ribosomal protein S7
MRGLTLILATTLTFVYGFAAQAAMTVDRAETIRRAERMSASAPTTDATRIWYGGMLAPVTVEVTPEPKCTLT